MDKPPKPGKPFGKPGKPDKPGKPTKPSTTGSPVSTAILPAKPDQSAQPAPTTSPTRPTKPIKPEHVDYTCPLSIMTYNPEIKRADLKEIDLTKCDNSNNPGSICETKCSSLYEATQGNHLYSYLVLI